MILEWAWAFRWLPPQPLHLLLHPANSRCLYAVLKDMLSKRIYPSTNRPRGIAMRETSLADADAKVRLSVELDMNAVNAI